MTKKRIIFVLLAGAAGFAGWYYRDLYVPQDTGTDESALETVQAKFAAIARTVNTDGRVEALLVVDVKSKASGAVETVLVQESDLVEGPRLAEDEISELFPWPLLRTIPGQLLIELDPIDEQRNVAKFTAQLKAEVAKFERAKAELVKITESVNADLAAAQAEREGAMAELKVVDAQHAASIQTRAGSQISLTDAKERYERQAKLWVDRLTSEQELTSAKNLVTRLSAEFAKAEADIIGAEARKLQSQGKIHQSDARIQVAEANRRSIDVQTQEISLAAAQVEAAKVALADARRRLDETSIVAPIDAVVVAKAVERGQVISSGTQNVGGGTSLLTLADISRLFVIASVPEADIALVRDPAPVEHDGRIHIERQAVRISADAYPNRVFKGEVVYRVPQAVTENNVTTVKVRIEVTDKDKNLLLPGMTTNVEILAQRKDRALTVPAAAVLRGDGDKRYVYVLDEAGKPVRHKVTVGISTATSVEIVEGLRDGQAVVASAAAVEPPDSGSKKKGKSGSGSSGSGMLRSMPRR